MTKFFEHVMCENREISKNVGKEVPMLPMTDGERALYDAAKNVITAAWSSRRQDSSKNTYIKITCPDVFCFRLATAVICSLK